MTYSHSTNALLTAAAELSRGDRMGLARARLAFQSLAEVDDERAIAEVVGLILLGVNATENQERDAKGSAA